MGSSTAKGPNAGTHARLTASCFGMGCPGWSQSCLVCHHPQTCAAHPNSHWLVGAPCPAGRLCLLLTSGPAETAESSSVFGPHKTSPQLSFLYSRSPVLDVNPALPLQSGCGCCGASASLRMGWKQCPGVPWGSHTSHFQTDLYLAVADFSSPN